MDEIVRRRDKRAIWLWAGAFMAGMFGMAGWLSTSGLMGKPWSLALMALPMLLLIPMMRASERSQRASGCASPVAVRYNRHMLVVSFAYMIGLFTATSLYNAYDLTPVQAGLLSLLPTLPIFGMIWAMGRYLVEEQDEYLRARVVASALIATGLLLAIATFWGFLASFKAVPAMPGWAVVPIWAVGLGVGQLVNKVRGA